jgi:putative Mn2+ efflux pump MntP
MGRYIIWSTSFFKRKKAKYAMTTAKIALLGFVCSIDNLVLGFVFGLYHLPISIIAASGIMALISIVMSIIGLQMGKYVGHFAKKWGEHLEGIIFILLSLCFLFNLL